MLTCFWPGTDVSYGVQAATALMSMVMRASALENQHLFDFLARSNAVLS